MTLYAHLQENSTAHLCDGIRPVPPEGCPLPADMVIGKVGRTGGARGAHLHLEYSPMGIAIRGKGGKFFLNNRFLRDPHPCISPMQLTSPNPTLTCGTPDPNVSFSATGGWPQYTWTTTKGVVTPGADTKSAVLRPPLNSGGFTGLVAYRRYSAHTTTSAAIIDCGGGVFGSACINPFAFVKEFGCDDMALPGGGWQQTGCFPFPPEDTCPVATKTFPCNVGCNPVCNLIPPGTTCAATEPQLNACPFAVCDKRTDDMIAARCNPCVGVMTEATVTVRDSHPDPSRRSELSTPVTVR